MSVACSHLVSVFWLMRSEVSDATLTPEQAGANDAIVAVIEHVGINFGQFGVGVFFLISGLVIPISLAAHSRGGFLLARALRIYPTYVAALLIEVAVLRVNALYWGRPFLHGAWTIASNCLLIQDLVGQPSMDPVTWTLCIELRFYVVMALIAGAIRRGSVLPLVGVALAALAINLAVARGLFGPQIADATVPAFTASTESLFIAFMLLGVVFNYHLRGHLGAAGLALWVGVLGAILLLCWRISIFGTSNAYLLRTYSCAFVLFALLYALRRWVRPSRVLDGMAAISFPFYLVHSLVGYSVLKLLMLSWGWGYRPALAAAVAVAVLLATGLHVAVERPTTRMGRALGRRRTADHRPGAATSSIAST